MMPWRAQAALLWRVVRWVIWLPGAALWVNVTYKILQAALCVAVITGQLAAVAVIAVVFMVLAAVPWGRP